MYNPARRFAFTNILEEDFTSYWGGSPIVVKAGQTVELPHHLADKLTDEIVNKIMISNAKTNEVEYYQKNPNAAVNTYRAPSSLGVPQVRKQWEDKVVRELKVDEESPEMQVLRAQIRDEIQADMSGKASTEPVQVPASINEFAELGREDVVIEKKPIKVKTLK
jgi:hypothetical protein